MPASAPLYPDTFFARSPKPLPRRRNPRLVTLPEHVGPHVKLVFALMSQQRMTYDSLEELSGIRRPTIKQWRRKNRPGLESLESVLAALGHGLVAVPALDVIQPDLAGELTALALKLRMNIPQTWAALIDIGVEQKLLRMSADERRAILAERESRKTAAPPRQRRPEPTLQ